MTKKCYDHCETYSQPSSLRGHTFESKADILLRKFKEYFTDISSNQILPIQNPELTLTQFNKIFQQAGCQMKSKMFSNIPANNYNTQPKWWDKECQTLKSLKNFALREYRRTNDEMYYKRYRSIRNQLKATCKLYRKIYEKNNRVKLVESRNNVSQFWKLLKGSTIRKSNNIPITGDKFFNYFQSLFEKDQNLQNNSNILDNVLDINDSTDLNEIITEEEITYSINKLKSNKSGGPDGLMF